MTTAPDLIKFGRTSFLTLIDGLSVEQLNTIPKGFNNNLIWNLAHVIAAQQALCYKRANVPALMDPHMMETYQRGTAPTTPLDQKIIEHIKTLALSTVVQLEADLQTDLFKNYTAFEITTQNLPVNNIQDALAFVVFHEGLHLGYAQSLKRAVLA